MFSRFTRVLIIGVSHSRAVARPLFIARQYTRLTVSCQVPDRSLNLKSPVAPMVPRTRVLCARYRSPERPLSPTLAPFERRTPACDHTGVPPTSRPRCHELTYPPVWGILLAGFRSPPVGLYHRVPLSRGD